MGRADSILDLVGDTPLVRLNVLPREGGAAVWAKLESFNPCPASRSASAWP